MSKDKTQETPEDVNAIRVKRLETLLGVWRTFTDNHRFAPDRLTLSTPLANEVVEHYLADRNAMRNRYKIKGRIQLHKVAGLMAAAIVRYRPIVPLVEDLQPGNEFYANEILAVYHGLAVCGEYNGHDHLAVLDEPWFRRWRDELVYMLHYRNFTPESLCFIFLTLAATKFPAALEAEND